MQDGIRGEAEGGEKESKSGEAGGEGTVEWGVVRGREGQPKENGVKERERQSWQLVKNMRGFHSGFCPWVKLTSGRRGHRVQEPNNSAAVNPLLSHTAIDRKATFVVLNARRRKTCGQVTVHSLTLSAWLKQKFGGKSWHTCQCVMECRTSPFEFRITFHYSLFHYWTSKRFQPYCLHIHWKVSSPEPRLKSSDWTCAKLSWMLHKGEGIIVSFGFILAYLRLCFKICTGLSFPLAAQLTDFVLLQLGRRVP